VNLTAKCENIERQADDFLFLFFEEESASKQVVVFVNSLSKFI
jgi:hypothetical protein